MTSTADLVKHHAAQQADEQEEHDEQRNVEVGEGGGGRGRLGGGPVPADAHADVSGGPQQLGQPEHVQLLHHQRRPMQPRVTLPGEQLKQRA